jgi:hypothetical protein
VLVLLLAGAALRLYFVQAHSSFTQSDEALMGLMAKHIISRGQLPIFAYEEERSGALIAYLAAPFFYLFGASNLVLKTVAWAISLLFATLLYLLARRIGGMRAGLLALALSVFAPPYLLMWSVHAAAEYMLVMVFGVGALLLCDSILFNRWPGRNGAAPAWRYGAYALLGLVMGIGFWVSPLIISFVGGVWIALFLRDRKCFFRPTALVFLIFLVIGNLPALLFNTNPELRAAGGLPDAANWISYTSLLGGSSEPLWSRVLRLPGDLVQVATVSLPVMVGGAVWQYETGFLRRSIAAVLVSFWSLAMLYTLGRRARLWWGSPAGRHWSLVPVDPLILQFLLAVMVFVGSQYGWLVQEPRYLMPVFVFLLVAGGCFLDWLFARGRLWGVSALIVVVALNLGLSVWFSESLDPDHGLWPKDEGLIAYLIDHQIEHPVANYWIAYSMAFESDEKVVPVPIGHAKFSMYEEVLAGPAPTYYILRKREREDRYFDFFKYSLSDPQWSARDFAGHLQELGIPEEVYSVHEFEHYVLYGVPHDYLDSTVISLPGTQPASDPYAEASRYLGDLLRPGDALILSPPTLGEALRVIAIEDSNVYSVPEEVPLAADAVRAKLDQIAQQHQRLFLLLGDTSSSDPAGLVESWLNHNTFRAGDRWIGNLRLLTYGSGERPPADQPSQQRRALFGDWIELTGMDLSTDCFAPGDVVPMTLFWESRQPIAQNLKVFIHLLDAGGQLVAQRDGEPVGGMRPTSTWLAAESVVDRHGVLLPGDLVAGEYQLVLGLYDPVTGERLPVTVDGQGPAEDAVRAGNLRVCTGQ